MTDHDDHSLQNQIDELQKEIGFARNESLSYYNTNFQMSLEGKIRGVEAFQARRQRDLAREMVETGRRLKIAFMLPEISLWDVFAPIYRAMQASERFDPIVVAFTRADVTSEKSKTKILATLEKMKVKFVFFELVGKFYPSIAELEVDVIFYTLGSIAYPEPYRIEFTSQYCLTCYISYGFLMANEHEYQFGQTFHHTAWRIFASTPREEAEYGNRSRRLTNNIVTTGYTKFDLYPKNIPPPPQRPLIIWAPHWTIGTVYPALNLGTFAEICNDMATFMENSCHIDFIFKPHPNLKYACEKTTFMSHDIYESYLHRLKSMSNVSVVLDGDNINRFVNSSAMITDSVSFLAEYIPSKRPLLFLSRPDRSKFSETGESIVGAHYIGVGMDAIRSFTQDVVDGIDPQYHLRAGTMKRVLHIQETSATSQIIDNIANALGLRQTVLVNR
jgi:hypothetical protein